MDFKLHYVPSLIFVWFVLTIMISYIVAVAAETVHPFLPIISELSILQPSRAIFVQMLHIGALLCLVGLYIRYKQIDFVIITGVTNLSKVWNEISFYVGFAPSVGLTLVANSPTEMNGYFVIFVIHLFGAFMTFGLGFVYMLIQSKITIDLQPYYDRYPKVAVSKFMQYLRLVMTVIFAINGLIAMIGLIIYLKMLESDSPLICTPESPLYTIHLATAIAEWIMVIIFFSFIVTMTNELKFMSYKGICIENLIDNEK